ncbi:MAG TPA: cytochrome b, partial [Thermohalobaculum sp.]|nr:cytochrome b [Thermohalobaculum sp.]
PRYTLAQRLVHWAIAAIAICVLIVGVTLGTLGFDGVKATFGMDTTNLLYKYHKTFGVVLLGLMTVRLVLKLMHGRPDYDPPLPRFNKSASAAVHGLLYVALLVQPVLGWLATAAGGFPVEFFSTKLPGLIAKDPALSKTLYGLHGSVGWLILTLITIHVGAALMHRYVKRDTVMSRMSLF